jgi:parallel beta-helix repeat protein
MRSTLVVVALFLATPAHAITFYLEADGSGDFPTIQEAFDAAGPTDEIVLRPGVYHEADIEASPLVKIRGEGGPDLVIIDASDGDKGIYSDSDLGPRSIEGITFRGAKLLGISLEGGGTQRITDCVVSNCAVGIYLRNMSGIVEWCTVVGGYTDTGTSGSGISLSNSSPFITNCLIAFNDGCGVVEWTGSGTQFYCNDVYGNGDGDYCVFPDPTGAASNISEDPQFCRQGVGDLSVTTISPCSPENSPCGDRIGALDPGCVATVGACCDLDSGQCIFTSESLCAIAGEQYMFLLGASCDPNPCPQPTGACCLADGSCEMASEDDCGLVEGEFRGYDAPCDPNPCSVTGMETSFGMDTWIGQPHPNPSDGHAILELRVFEPTRLVIEVFDTNGRRVSHLLEEDLSVGPRRVSWDGTDGSGRNVGSGVYYLRITTADGVETRQVQIIR